MSCLHHKINKIYNLWSYTVKWKTNEKCSFCPKGDSQNKFIAKKLRPLEGQAQRRALGLGLLIICSIHALG